MTISLQSGDETRARFVHRGRSNIGKEVPITCFLTPSMRSTQEYNPKGVLKQAMVLGFDACREESLLRYQTSEFQCLQTEVDLLSSQ